jgi:hypothetical protein
MPDDYICNREGTGLTKWFSSSPGAAQSRNAAPAGGSFGRNRPITPEIGKSCNCVIIPVLPKINGQASRVIFRWRSRRFPWTAIHRQLRDW